MGAELFLGIGAAIIAVAAVIGRAFRKSVNKPMPGHRVGTGIGVEAGMTGRARGDDGDDANGGGGGV